MVLKTVTLEWEGWCLKKDLPAEIQGRAGLYCFWVAKISKKADGGTTIYHKDARLVYIGQAGDLGDRLVNKEHEKEACAKKEKGTDESIVYTYVLLPTADYSESWRKAIENCLIAHHTPPCNDADLTYHWTKGVDITNKGVTFGKLTSTHKCKGTEE